MTTFGERLADKLIGSEKLEDQFVKGSFMSQSRIFRLLVLGIVGWKAETRSSAYTFTVGDDDKSRLDMNKLGKGEWTEVASSAD